MVHELDLVDPRRLGHFLERAVRKIICSLAATQEQRLISSSKRAD